MAVMIPDSCPSKATPSEKGVYRLLQDLLPDDFTVWYEPDIEGRYPDFTLLAATFGLLTLEVKGWYIKQLSRVNEQQVELLITREGQTHLELHKNPYRQVRDYMFGAMNMLSKEATLRQSHGTHKGRLCFPCGCGVLFTNITRGQLAQAGLNEIFPPTKAICRDELETLQQAKNDAAIIRRLKQFFLADFPFTPLTESQCRSIHGVIHKEVVLPVKPQGPAPAPTLGQTLAPATPLAVLDRKQEQIARHMGEGHRIVAGVAGSGKTVLLLARAKLLALRYPQDRILVLCYNGSLSAYLKAQIGADPEYRNIEVWTFKAWAERQTGIFRDRSNETFEQHERRLTEAILAMSALWPEDRKYGAVLVDEALDFYPEWFCVCVQILKKAANGDLLVVVDGAQSVYGRPRSFTWKSLGIHAQGRTRSLSTNYRNTKQIIEFAWSVAQSQQTQAEDETPHARIQPTHATRNGTTPVYQACRTVAEERELIAQLVHGLTNQGVSEEDICVLYPRKEGRRIEDLYARLQDCGDTCWITNEADPTARHQFMTRPGVRLCTIYSAKGLQFPVVIFSAVDQLPNPMSNAEEADSNLLYVGLTRAEQRLILTWTGRSAFTDRVLRSTKATPLRSEAIGG